MPLDTSGPDATFDGAQIGGDFAGQQLQVAGAKHTRSGAGIGEIERSDEIAALLQRTPSQDGIIVIHRGRIETPAKHKNVGDDVDQC
jgi:hypothetical protein